MSTGAASQVPFEGEAGRLTFGRRVGSLAIASGFFGVCFDVIHLLNDASRRGLAAAVEGMLRPSGATFLVSLALLGLGFCARGAARSRRAIEILDVLVAVVASGGYAITALQNDLGNRPELGVLLIATYVLVGRSALVPSTGRRTLYIGLAALAPLLPATYGAYHALLPDLARVRTIYVAEWGAVAVVVSALTSRRIFGLAKKVEEARRLGPYTLEEKLGEGGMGEVYRARHALLRRPTAVKLLPQGRTSEKDVDRFEREVQMTSQLSHPSTIQVYDFGRADDGTFYYAMELIDGLTLEDLVLEHGAQAPGRVARILADVCASLSEAHEAGLVHRDIKPQNVMLCARAGLFDVVKVLDFGLVRSLEGGAASAPTANQILAGTPAYMAPEAVLTPSAIDARSDLYAVGALGYYLLAGAPVFAGESALAVVGRHVHEAPEPFATRTPRRIPEALEALVFACLAKSPGGRPESARALREALLAIAAVEPWSEEEASEFWRRERGKAPSNRKRAAGIEGRSVLLTRREP